MTATLTRSAFPVPVGELLARAVDMAVEAGEVPSRNRLMADLRIGPVKATTIRTTLLAEPVEWGLAKVLMTDSDDVSAGARAQFTADVLARLTPLTDDAPGDVEPVPDESDGRHLRAVPDVDTTPPAPTPDVDTPADVPNVAVAYPGTDPTADPVPALDHPAPPADVSAPSGLVTGAAYPGTNSPANVRPKLSGRVWAYIGALLGGSVSIAANIAHSFIPPRPEGAGPDWVPAADWTPEPGAVVGATFWPVALFVVIEILARVPWPDGARWIVARVCGLLPVAIVAAVVSYRHLSGLLAHYGEDPLTVAIGPFAVDGLMVVATCALIALGRIKNTKENS